MYTSIYQNSYVILIISFIALSLVCYMFELGYTSTIQDGTVVKKFSWKYPLAISLIIWLFWHFYLYPPAEEMVVDQQTVDVNYSAQKGGASPMQAFIPKTNKLMAQKINMNNWN